MDIFDNLLCVCYLDGQRSECGYRFTIRSAFSSGGFEFRVAFHTVAGLRYFMQSYGLTIDRTSVVLDDLRDIGRGRHVHFRFNPKRICRQYIWKRSEIPDGAKQFIALVNGSYVNNYAIDRGDEVLILRPNPNAKDIYIPYDYEVCRRQFG